MSLLSTLDAGVLTLTLNRPARRNALDAALVEALLEALDRAELDAEVRVVALRGAGPDFCAGADLEELLASADRPLEENIAGARRLGRAFLRMRELSRPVVAVVHGRALGGGAGLATAADLVLAHEGAQIGFPEITRGFVPAMVMTMLRRLTGERRAFDLVATGRVLQAREALDLGLISRVAPAGRFDSDAAELLTRLAAMSPSAMTLVKRLFYQLDGPEFGDGIELGARVNALARTHPDFRAAVAAFLKP